VSRCVGGEEEREGPWRWAVMHAKSIGATVALVLEQDSATDSDVQWAPGNWQELNNAMDAKVGCRSSLTLGSPRLLSALAFSS
jgi:hypothetical protein